MPMFEAHNRKYLPVLSRPTAEEEEPELLGTIHHVDALKAVNRALAETAREEHS